MPTIYRRARSRDGGHALLCPPYDSAALTPDGFTNFPSCKNAIVCATATLFRTSHGCDVPTTTWSAMPSSHGVLHRHPTVMRLRQHRAGHGIDRAVSRDDADGIIERRKQRIDRIAPLGAELLSGGSEEGAVGAEILQPVGDFAAAVRRAQHHNAAEAVGPMPGDVDAGQEARPWNGRRNERSRRCDRQSAGWRDGCPPPAPRAPCGGSHSPG